MNGFRYKLYQFMQGRRGIDQFGKFLMVTAMILLLVAMIPVKAAAFAYYLGIFLFIYGYYRAFSRNLYKREQENLKFIAWKYKFTEKKYYAFFKCPTCGQKLRAPKGKGNIRVTCQSCHNSFTKRV